MILVNHVNIQLCRLLYASRLNFVDITHPRVMIEINKQFLKFHKKSVVTIV